MEGVPVREVAESVGTPCFLYSHKSIVDSFNGYSKALSDIDHVICFSVKANSNLAVLRLFADMDAGFDIVSAGELSRVIKAGGDMAKVVFSGVGKKEAEIAAAIDAGILFFNVESVEELNCINETGMKMGRKAPVALRVNPDINPRTHRYISTGFKKSKFGIQLDRSVQIYKNASKMEGIEIVGIDAHIGSQIFDLSSFTDSVERLVLLADTLKGEGIDIRYMDIGGGLAINYRTDETPPSVFEYAEVIKKVISEKSPYTVIVEPGRSLIGNSGIMITEVLYNKEGTSKDFVIVDAAMNDLIRPAFYDAHHEIVPVNISNSGTCKVDVVGPICESGDFLATDRELPAVSRGDYLSVLSAGAYGFVMSSNYNSRTRAPEVMVKENEFEIIKQRETFDDLIRGERIPGFLKS